MILLIVLAIWVCGTICYFAWRLMPDVDQPKVSPPTGDDKSADAPDKDSSSDS